MHTESYAHSCILMHYPIPQIVGGLYRKNDGVSVSHPEKELACNTESFCSDFLMEKDGVILDIDFSPFCGRVFCKLCS